jgi:hypothetical protein
MLHMTNQAVLTAKDVIDIAGLNLQIAKVAVWAIINDSPDQARRLLAKQGYNIDPVMLREVGIFFAEFFQVQAPRTGDLGRSHCFLCSRKLPSIEGQLCDCYKEARATVYIDDIASLADIEAYRKQSPHTYRSLLVSTHLCATPGCGCLFTVKMDFVEDTMRRLASRSPAQSYRPPTICADCLHTAKERKWRSDQMRHEKEMLEAQRRTSRGEKSVSELGHKIVQAQQNSVGEPQTGPHPKQRRRDRNRDARPPEVKTVVTILTDEGSPELRAAILAAGEIPSDFADLPSAAPTAPAGDTSESEVSEAS